MIHHRWAAPGGSGGLAAMVLPVLAVPMLVSALAVFIPAPTATPLDIGDDPRAVELLHQSAGAGEQVSYTGTQYVSTWSALTKSATSTSAIVQVRHAAGGETEVGLHNEQSAILQGHSTTNWLAGDDPVDLLLDAYNVRMAGTATVAGRSTDVVEARRSDGSVAVRLWLDRETALSLRRESFARDGYPLGASAFVDISIGGADMCCEFETAGDTETLDPDTSMLRWSDIERLRDEGWHCPPTLSGGMVLYEARRLGDAVQLSYSDGVMTVSVFQQPGRLDREQLDGYTATEYGDGLVYTRPGPPARLTWSTGEHVITVVAEAPMHMVEVLIDRMPPERVSEPAEKDDGLFDRIGRGAQRVGSWLNPFG
ncbi:sigma-E factor negative regulatory protein RseB [Haloactinopolyspora alba]|uniref:Sigma-E factor negative regulatory protein RseB n=1 Tax=Haloactinopolyspora alba TaxID=648780 RepID=A0A2P8DXB6_9ACTN|nr:sigma-E factor regulatory protein RseB domain-containing protein [Haloactinopolyspora alba]PSL01870.1 sigma-E factor negative regulatory protein RseB [Haloactinopolyspora alba]